MFDWEQHPANSKPRHRVSRRASLGPSAIGRTVSPAALHHSIKPSASSESGAPNERKKKKQTRRASLGQMLGSAQKLFHHKDDEKTVATDTSFTISSDLLHTDGTEQQQEQSTAIVLLREVKELIQHHTTRKIEMEVMIESDLELAKARYQSGSPMGAVLSMRRVHKNTTLLAYAAAARYQLAQIRNNLQEVLQQQEQDADTADVHEHRRAVREITETLLKADAPTPTDDILLQQLQAQIREIGE